MTDPIVWRNAKVLKVSGVTARTGIFTSKEGMTSEFTPELCKSLFSTSNASSPLYLTHEDRDVCGYIYKLGYDTAKDQVVYEGFVFDPEKQDKVATMGYDMISPEIIWSRDPVTKKIVSGEITGNAFVINPALRGTNVSKEFVAFSAPSHPWSYDKSEGEWSKPSLKDFTDKSWEELSDSEKRSIAGHFAYSANMPPTKFEDLKFPHHDPKSHAVVWSALSNSMARLNQASISDEDKKSVYSHIAKHYDEFGKEPPKMYEAQNMTRYSMEVMADGSYVIKPTEEIKTVYSQADVDVLNAKINELQQKVSTYENSTPAPVAVPPQPVAPVVPTATPPVVVTPPVVQNVAQPVESPYKEKFEKLLAVQVESVSGELKNLGVKDPNTIGTGLGVEQRLAVLNSVKENVIKATPAVVTDTVTIQAVNPADKDTKLRETMIQNGIDPSNMKYFKPKV